LWFQPQQRLLQVIPEDQKVLVVLSHHLLHQWLGLLPVHLAQLDQELVLAQEQALHQEVKLEQQVLPVLLVLLVLLV
jgi:hypothetical protein